MRELETERDCLVLSAFPVLGFSPTEGIIAYGLSLIHISEPTRPKR